MALRLKYIGRFIVTLLFTVSVIIGSAQPIQALNGQADYNFFENNNIKLYDPSWPACGTEIASILDSANLNYLGEEVVNSAQMAQIITNQPVYTEAAEANDIPWQLLAAIHLYETGLAKEGPEDKNGPYHDVSKSSYSVGELTDSTFKAATNQVAGVLHGIAQEVPGSKDLMGTSGINNVKSVAFRYTTNNSELAANKQVYVDQAKSLNLTDDQAARGEGSPEVMNGVDAKRDGSKASSNWGYIPEGKKELVYPAPSNYGIVVYYAAIAGIKIAPNACGGGLLTGGMNLEQAKKFMYNYTSNPDNVKYIGGSGKDCLGGPLSNCVSFSVYFINRFTTIEKMGSGWSPGNGSGVVGNIIARNPDIPYGTQPQPYAIFSTPSGSMMCGSTKCGHSGVILGVDTDRGVVVVGEAACGAPPGWDTAREYSLAKFSSGEYQYVYTTDLLKEDP